MNFKKRIKSIQTAGYNGARTVVQVLVESHFELVSSVLALEATKLVSEPVTQMAVELIINCLISEK